ncbi:MAG: response regulator [Chloroflexota bacterium]|nr:response regulator [Chloroflexota bacterium]
MKELSKLGSPPPPALRVLLAVGLSLVRGLLHDLLSALPGLEIVAEVSRSGDLLRQTRQFMPDLVLLDWDLGGLGALRELRTLTPVPQVIILTSGADADYCAAVLTGGGAACLARERLHRELAPAIRGLIARRGEEAAYV